MKRYLIEPQSVPMETHDASKSSDGDSHPAAAHRVIYRIVDSATGQTLPPESEDIAVVASTCTQLNDSANLTGGELPADIVQSIEISKAKAIYEQPAVLANLALAQKIFNQNMQQQNAVSHQQAMNQIKLAVIGKYVAMIDDIGSGDQARIEKMGADIEELVRQLERILDENAGDRLSLQLS